MPRRRYDYFKIAVHAAALVPLAALIFDAFMGRLGFDPIREITFRTGRDALVLLMLSLAVTPVNRFFGLRAVVRVRRALGVYAFVYASLHFLTFIGLDYGFNLTQIVEGISQRPFALVGFVAFLTLVPLVVTSTNGWKRRLGRNWKRLHRLVYLTGVLVIVHFAWAAKQDYSEPLTYGAVVAILLLARVRLSLRRQPGPAAASSKNRPL